ncbi:hypothetical protein [Providencia alcalifaciens]|nr:hypothetical protein [Providencia alcalifaciens]MTC16353.1 hypothetical protein [Providencia alcalifaciens]MTC63519.1 hypothetical protein [Providencia alcalifaciens]WGZ55802.1 hypothetical protein PO864_07650 [Providencia alcalifaciens]
MKINPNSLNLLSTPRTYETPPVSTSDLHTRMNTRRKPNHIMKDIQNYHEKNIPHMSENAEEKLNLFIQEFTNQDSQKSQFLLVFKTMINLNRKDKESFIANVAQTLKSSSEASPSLYKDFTKSLQRYMAITFMNAPFKEQLNKNMTNFNIEGDDEDINEL